MAVEHTRPAEVRLAVGAYGEMTGMVSEGHPGKLLAMSLWLAALLGKLVEWEVISMEEMDKLLGELQTESRQRIAERFGFEQEPDTVRDLLAREGL